MNKDELKSILEQHRLWLDGNDSGKRADLERADLRSADLQDADLQYADLRSADLQDADLKYADLKYADLRSANLQYADLQYADLQGADLQGANLQGANLRYADLQSANLQGANLQDADLQGADLRYADLQYADLEGADLDYSCLPLWCGSKGMIVDRPIAAQIAAHFCALECDDADYIAARKAILEFAQTSHRAMDLGLLEEIVKECNDVATPIDVALRKRIAELESAQRWIPVSERLPEAETRVLVATPTGYMEVDWRFSEPIIDCGLANFYRLDNVTHWMPLPESPNDTQTDSVVYGKDSD